MTRKTNKKLTLILTTFLSIGLLLGCGEKKPIDEKGNITTVEPTNLEKTIVRIGAQNKNRIDPKYVDPVSGKSLMDPNWYAGAQKGEEELRKKLNVEIEFVQYPGNASEVLLKATLSNDPICDIAGLPGGPGTIISQNVAQSLDEYAYLFKDECQWMFPDKIYGHHYLLNWETQYILPMCLSYNINCIQKIDALKQNGKTLLPVDLWKDGKWTWTAFEDYLTKVKSYYNNKKAPIRTEVTITPMKSDLKDLCLQAIKSTGGSVYSKNGMGASSIEAKKGVEYIDDLYSKKLVEPSIGYSTNALRDGETVFADIPTWSTGAVSGGLSKRGESLGIVPFPRPNDIPANDPRYQQLVVYPGTLCIPKGISKEKIELCLKTLKIYYNELFKARRNTPSVEAYFKDFSVAKSEALIQGFDVTNDAYGDSMVEAFRAYNPNGFSNEAYTVVPWAGQWIQLVRNSILGTNGTPKYDIAIDGQKEAYESQINYVQNILKSDKIIDNIPPTITLLTKDIAIAKDTDLKTINWSKYFESTDNIDGHIDIKNVTIDTSKIKQDTVGMYEKGLLANVKDKSGNENKKEFNVIIYDPTSKTVPVFKVKKSYRSIKLNEDISKINWSKDFVDTAISGEGFDLMNYITVDISSLDVTRVGKYSITLTVSDYSGNKAKQNILVEVIGK